MSATAQNGESPVGVIRIPLDTDRTAREDYRLLRLRGARSLAVLDTDGEAKLRFGSKDNTPLDVRDFSSITVREDSDSDALGEVYVENPAGASGDELVLATGVRTDVSTEQTETAASTVDVTDEAGREVGRVTVKDSAGNVIDPASTALEGALNATGDAYVVEVSGSVTAAEPTAVVSFTHSTAGTAAEQLPTNDVHPEGTALVQAAEGNGSDVFVGNGTTQAHRLNPGDSISMNVPNTDAIYVQTPNAGDSVNVTAEQ